MPLDADAQAILNYFAKYNAPAITGLTPHTARKLPTLKNAVEEMTAENPAARAAAMIKPMPRPVGSITHQLIPSLNGDILARIYTPKGDGPFTVIVYFHGGGWVIANLEVYDSSCRALCNDANSIVISVAYRQAPEYKYPAAVEDAYAATQWAIEHAAEFNGVPTFVAVAGESAGGNLAAVTCLKAKKEGGFMPAAQLLIYPVTDARMNTASYSECADAAPLNAAMMPWFWDHYLENESQGLEPYASPLLAKDLSGLPPAVVITAEHDPLRDEGEAYAEKLKQAGVPVRMKRFDGVMHEFFGLSGVVAKAAQAVTEASQGLEEAFESVRVGKLRTV